MERLFDYNNYKNNLKMLEKALDKDMIKKIKKI